MACGEGHRHQARRDHRAAGLRDAGRFDDAFYSHAHTYYFTPFNYTGVVTTAHISEMLDLWLGVDGGQQVTFGYPNGDPNGKPAGLLGFGLNKLLDNKLTVLALSHVGPENAFPRVLNGAFNANDPDAGRNLRSYTDIVFTYRFDERVTSATESNYDRDDYGNGTGVAEAYSAIQYLGYAFAAGYTLNLRGELYRDTKNFFVSTPTDNSGVSKANLGIASALTSPTLSGVAGRGTTFAAGTIGITFKPEISKPFALFAIRPEIRYDRIVAGDALYGGRDGPSSRSRDQLLFGGDVILGF